jgi:general secretion pathway protein G
MRRTRSRESRILFPWERRGTLLARLSRRHARLVLAAAVVLLGAWALLRVESRRRAVHATRASIANVMRAVEAFRADHEGRCPAGAAQLVAPTDGHEPYLARAPRDGWGRALRIACPGRLHPASADVTSAGPSGSFEDQDQIQ